MTSLQRKSKSSHSGYFRLAARLRERIAKGRANLITLRGLPGYAARLLVCYRASARYGRGMDAPGDGV